MGMKLVHALAILSAAAVALAIGLVVTYPSDQDPTGLAVLLAFAEPFAGFLVVYVVLLCARSAWRAWGDMARADESSQPSE